jgi:hypothetical protein
MQTTEIFPTASTLRRTIKELIPRDWFALLDVQDGGEEETVYVGEDGVPVVYQSTGSEISPAVIEALVFTKIELILWAINEIRRSQLLLSPGNGCTGDDIDSWAYQYYGDFLCRRDGEEDGDYKQRILCLLYNISAGFEQRFLPNTTEDGITSFLDCFGFTITVIPTTDAGNIVQQWFWWSEGITVARSAGTRPLALGWKSSIGALSGSHYANPMAWDDIGALVAVEDMGEERNQMLDMLIKRAKAFGVKFSYLLLVV